MRGMVEAKTTAEVQPIWCIVANVVDERPYGPGGHESRRGIRLFPAGAKVWVPDGYPGMGYETVTVIGRTRHGHRYATVDVRSEHLTNWKVKLVYSPAVRARIDDVFPSVHHGFSSHGADRNSDAYRDDLQLIAERFQERTDTIHQQWQQQRASAGGASPGSNELPSGTLSRWAVWLRRRLAVRS